MRRVRGAPLTFPPQWSDMVKDLINSLLQVRCCGMRCQVREGGLRRASGTEPPAVPHLLRCLLLLQPNPELRLGIHGGIAALKAHAWFKVSGPPHAWHRFPVSLARGPLPTLPIIVLYRQK
jgi:hypothetical protein